MGELGKVFVEVDGKLTNINELTKEEYETFLERMHLIRVAHIATISRDKIFQDE